ncbi:MAG: efflux RND transporter permease subunit, partial [Methylococcales bacterium]|nr:efflux RND transporter permease subunit [Methylococcales bacterium]
MFLIHFSIKNPLLTNLLMILVVIVGYGTWKAMPQEMFPVVALDKIQVTTIFEGASPEEVELQVTLPLEEALETLQDIDAITSVSNEGVSQVTLKLKSEADVDDIFREVESAIDQIKDFPEEAEDSKVSRLKTRFPVISVSVYGDVAPGMLFDLAEETKRELLKLPGVGNVGTAGIQDWELWVEVDPFLLAASGVSLDQISTALRTGLADLPGGSLKGLEGDILLRGRGIAPEPEQVKALVIKTNAKGGRLRIGSLATVSLKLEEATTIGRYNGGRAVNLTVSKTADASSIVVAEKVQAFIAELQPTLPGDVNVGMHSDLSEYVKVRLNTVKSSGIIGLIFVLLSLYVFLNFRVAAITALGIPVSILFAIIVLHHLGYSINMVSLFAFLLCLGLIVDDSIIVTENIYRHIENGLSPTEAAERGAKEVFWPVVASTATSIAAFAPMFAITGTMGAFIVVIPVVVSAALIGSYFEAFAVLPSHAAEMMRLSKKPKHRRWKTLLEGYLQSLRWSLVNRYFVTILSIGVLIVTLVYAQTRLPFLLFGKVEIGQFFLNVEAPNTFSLNDTQKLGIELENAVSEVLDGDTELKSLLTNVGVTFVDFHRFKVGSNYVQLIVDLKKRKPEGFIENY